MSSTIASMVFIAIQQILPTVYTYTEGHFLNLDYNVIVSWWQIVLSHISKQVIDIKKQSQHKHVIMFTGIAYKQFRGQGELPMERTLKRLKFNA